MKKIFTIALMIITIQCFSQTTNDSLALEVGAIKKDVKLVFQGGKTYNSVYTDSITHRVFVISLNERKRFYRRYFD